jgi:hypothetical protein
MTLGGIHRPLAESFASSPGLARIRAMSFRPKPSAR